MKKSRYVETIEAAQKIYRNPVRTYTVKQIKALAKERGMTPSPNAGKPLITQCKCGKPIEKRYYSECTVCHNKR